MKKNILKYSLAALLVLPAVSSCEMDQQSPDNLTPGEAMTSMQDAESWRMGLYASLRGTYGSSVCLSDIPLDLFVVTQGDGNSNAPISTWIFENSALDTPTGIWASQFGLISSANQVIKTIPVIAENIKAEGQDLVELNQILGESYLIRAIAYQTLTTYFTDRFDASKSTIDFDVVETEGQLGLPLLTDVDIEALPSRAKLGDTYEFILKDLEMARSLMTDADPTQYVHNPDTKKYVLPSSVIDLIEARVRLTIGEYNEAAALAENIINSGDYPLLESVSNLRSMWLNDEGSEIIYQLFQNKDERAASWGVFTGLNLSLTSQLTQIFGQQTNAYAPSLMPTNEACMLYDMSDIRFDATFGYMWSYYAYMATGDISQGAYVYLLNKYPGNPALKKSQDDTYNTVKLFRAPEAYLLAAEAKVKAGDVAGGMSVLNKLHHTARKGDQLNASNAKEALQHIGDEYVREFIGEGLSFSAYKRLERTVKRDVQQFAGSIERYNAIEISPDNMRWTWEVPQQDLNANPNMERNWNIGN